MFIKQLKELMLDWVETGPELLLVNFFFNETSHEVFYMRFENIRAYVKECCNTSFEVLYHDRERT